MKKFRKVVGFGGFLLFGVDFEGEMCELYWLCCAPVFGILCSLPIDLGCLDHFYAAPEFFKFIFVR